MFPQDNNNKSNEMLYWHLMLHLNTLGFYAILALYLNQVIKACNNIIICYGHVAGWN